MKTIIDQTTKKLLFAVADDSYEPQENEQLIDELCVLETTNDIFFNEETREFYEQI